MHDVISKLEKKFLVKILMWCARVQQTTYRQMTVWPRSSAKASICLHSTCLGEDNELMEFYMFCQFYGIAALCLEQAPVWEPSQALTCEPGFAPKEQIMWISEYKI